MSRINHLKVKIKTLTAEAAIIRKEEAKALARPKLSVFKKVDGNWGWHPAVTSDEIARGVNSEYTALREHRVGIVRQAARTNLLAYGFLRGRSYSRMESTTYVAPDFAEVEKVARRFSPTKWDDARWKEWVAEAMAHLKAQADARKEAA